MRQRQLEPLPAGTAPLDAGADGLGEMRDRVERLLSAADDIISGLLSSNSEEFLTANRQHGGQ